MKPNLFIVGEPKTGTTALFIFLKDHPDVFMPHFKEIHYFCKDFHAENRAFRGNGLHYKWQTEEDYLDLFQVENKKVVGEASTNYLYSRVAAEEIHRFNPNAKIIMIFREPVDFLYSWHAQCRLTNGEHIKSFEKALAAEPERKQGRLLSRSVNVPSLLFYSERIKYAEQAERFFKLFPKENILPLIHEEFLKDNQATYDRILSFLNIDPGYVPQFREYHQNRISKNESVYKFIKTPLVSDFVKKYFSPASQHKLQQWAYKHILEYKKRPPLDEGLRRDLKEKCRGEVVKLGDLLGRDLVSLWGYDQPLAPKKK